MPTRQQLVRKGRKKRRKPTKTRAFQGCGLRSGIVLHSGIREPKKPNSGQRKCVRVRLSNGIEVTAAVPGEGHNLQEHARVLVRGGNRPDLPGVKYVVVRGTRDCAPVENSPKFGDRRNRGRSKYGTKKNT